jgi:hypothetical protein
MILVFLHNLEATVLPLSLLYIIGAPFYALWGGPPTGRQPAAIFFPFGNQMLYAYVYIPIALHSPLSSFPIPHMFGRVH